MMWANLFLSIFRILQRFFLVNTVYGAAMASLVPVRWMLSNFINTSAMFNAIYQWTRSKISGKAPSWSKTDHIIPVGFGEGMAAIGDLAPKRIPLVPVPRPPETRANEMLQ